MANEKRSVKKGVNERAEELMDFFLNGVPVARTLGMKLAFDERLQPDVTLPYNPGLDHGHGGIHGGMYMTLMDTAAWFASAVTHGPEEWITTSEMAVHFFKPSTETDLVARGRVLKSGRRQDVVEVHLHGAGGELVGHAVGTFVILPKRN